eukprot:3143092-Amphidinium_carterae.1
MERDWQAQLRPWQAEGKDVDALYSPRPKPTPATSTPEVTPTNDDVIVPVASCNRNIIEFCCDKHSTHWEAHFLLQRLPSNKNH